MAEDLDDARLADAFAHCASLVEDADPERATAILFAAPEKRRFLYALYAFDLETAGIRERVSQPIPGEMRLQWWRERIEAAGSGGEEAPPVAEALAETIRRHDLPVPAFDRLLEARIFDLYDDPMPSREAFEAYAGETMSTIVTLSAMVLGRKAAPFVAGLAGHAGVAALCRSTLLREPQHAARGQVFAPADLLGAAGLDRRRWLEGGEGAEPARQALRALGREHLSKVKAGWSTIPRALRPAFLPVRLLGRALDDGGRASPSGPLGRTWRYWRWMRAPEGPR